MKRIPKGLQSWIVTIALTVVATTGVVAMGSALTKSGVTAPTSVTASVPAPTPSTPTSASSAASPSGNVSLAQLPSGSGNGDGHSGSCASFGAASSAVTPTTPSSTGAATPSTPVALTSPLKGHRDGSCGSSHHDN